VLCWGTVASLQSVAPSYPALVALRTLLGASEAGFTGIPFYLSFFFQRSELAFRTAVFISAAPLATTFASSLAWAILRAGEALPIRAWRLLFLVEGFPSVVAAAIAWRVIPDTPETAWFLTSRERKVARLRLRSEREGSDGKQRAKSKASLRDALAALADPAAWVTASMFFLANMAYSSLPVFLPTILTSMGHSALASQALAAPPYLAAFASVLLTARISDRRGARGGLIAGHALASAAGYGLLALSGPLGLNEWARYAAVFPAAAGFFSVVALLIAWTVNNQESADRRGGAFALFQLVGQCGPLVGTRLYPDADAPLYGRGMTAMAGAMLGVAGFAIGLRWWFGRINSRLDAEEGEEGVGLVRDRGAREGGFRYML
jgi:MFS family permease